MTVDTLFKPLNSSSKFAVYCSVLFIGFTIVGTIFSPETSALRDHFILGELLAAPMGVISGALFKRYSTTKINGNKAQIE